MKKLEELISPEDYKFLDLLKKMLKIDPEDRITCR